MVAALADIDAGISAVRQELARRTLLTFTEHTFPGYEVNWHHRVVARQLDRVLTGEVRRLMLLLPPQNGKSEMVSRRFPAYVFGRRPNTRFVACSYSASLAQDMSRDVQKIMSTTEYQALFPRTRLATGRDDEIRTQGQFEIVGHRGHYVAAGVGGSITGKTLDIGVIDDPIKNRAEAESQVYRDNVWAWYTSTFATRQFGDQGAIVIALTRWHEDDMAGRLLKLARENPDADQWEVVSFPAVADVVRVGDPRQVGEVLWPAKYPIEELHRRKAGMGSYDWAALYQQQPAPPGGGMFQRAWFTVGVVPVPEERDGKLVTPRIKRCRFWDCAGSEATGKSDPDWTVGTLVAECAGIYYAEDVARVRTTAGNVDALMLQTAKTDPPGTLIREEQEPGSAGKSVVASHLKMLSGFDYAGVPATGEKSTRWRPFAAQAEGGNVRLVAGTWNRAWLDEMAFVPFGAHDDQADSASGAFNALAPGRALGDFGFS